MTDSGREERRGFLIEGRVQGVGFRWWTRKTAESLGIRGSVRNRSDGAVEVHAAGPSDALDELRSRLDRGPSSARVEQVRSYDSDLPVPDDRFRIER